MRERKAKRHELKSKIKLKVLPLARLLPNFTTIIGLCIGLSAIRLALNADWDKALWLVLLATIFDALDGRIARFFNATSRFGAELDSLSDFVNFGVTPSLMLYIFTLKDWGAIGWMVVLLYCACSALRLARFNTLSIDEEEDEEDLSIVTKKYFSGVPMPAGALLLLVPLMLSVHFTISLPNVVFWGNALWVSLILISKIPTYSFKGVKIPPKNIKYIMVALALAAGLAISYPWLFIPLLGAAYYSTFYFSWRSYKLEG